MKKISTLFYMVAGVLSVLGTTSCNDDESYDFPGDSMNRVYIKPYTGNDFLIVHTPVMSTSSFDLKIPAYVTRGHSEAIKATLAIDNSLIDAYNTANGTNYEALPEQALVIENQTVTIPAGSYYSADSLHLAINEEFVSQLRSETGYLIPVKLVSAEGGNAAVSTNMGNSYLVAGVEVKTGMIDDSASDQNTQGALVSERTGWTAYVEESDGVTVNGEISSLFDGNSSSEWSASSSQPFHIVFDMQKTQNVTAVTAWYSYYGWYDYCSFSQGTKMEYSQNGTDWEELGTVPSVNGKNVVLYAPVPMRYIRAEIPVVSDWSGTKASIKVGEFNVYVK